MLTKALSTGQERENRKKKADGVREGQGDITHQLPSQANQT